MASNWRSRVVKKLIRVENQHLNIYCTRHNLFEICLCMAKCSAASDRQLEQTRTFGLAPEFAEVGFRRESCGISSAAVPPSDTCGRSGIADGSVWFCPVELCTVVLSDDKLATGTLHDAY